MGKNRYVYRESQGLRAVDMPLQREGIAIWITVARLGPASGLRISSGCSRRRKLASLTGYERRGARPPNGS